MGFLGWLYDDRPISFLSLKECNFDVDNIEALEQVGDSVSKLSASLNPWAHNLAFVEHFSSTSFCLRTQRTDIVGWPLFSISSKSFSDFQFWSYFSLALKILWLTSVKFILFTKISSVELASYPFSLFRRSLNDFDRWLILGFGSCIVSSS